MDTLFSQKIIALSDQNTIIKVLYSALMLCVYAQKSPEEFQLAMQPDKLEIKDKLDIPMFDLAGEMVLNKQEYYDPLSAEVITELARLVHRLKDDLVSVAFEIREFIQKNPKRLGFSTTPKVLRDVVCELLGYYHKQQSLRSYYDFNGRIGDLMGCEVTHDSTATDIKLYVEETHPFFQQLGHMLLTLSHPHAKLTYTTRAALSYGYVTEHNIKVDCVISQPAFGSTMYFDQDDSQDTYLAIHSKTKRMSGESMSIQLALHSLKKDGIAIIVVPDGFLHKQGYDSDVRSYLVRADLVDAIITLPNSIYPGMTLSTSLLILKKNRKRPGLVTLVDLSQKTLNHKTIKEMISIFEKKVDGSYIPFTQAPLLDIKKNNNRLKPIDYLQLQTEYSTASLNVALKELEGLKIDFDSAYHDWKKLIRN